MVIMGLSMTSILQTPKIAQSQQNYEEYLIAETNTEQRLAQTNVGSGESINSNCGENSIIGGLIDAELCGTLDPGPTPEEICDDGIDNDGDMLADALIQTVLGHLLHLMLTLMEYLIQLIIVTTYQIQDKKMLTLTE